MPSILYKMRSLVKLAPGWHRLLIPTFVLLFFASALLPFLLRVTFYHRSRNEDASSPLISTDSIRWTDKAEIVEDTEGLQPRLVIAVISNNRYKPLVRLCESLARADYSEGNRYFKDNIDIIFNLEAASAKKLTQYVTSLSWPYGAKIIRKRFAQAGLIRAVSEAWYPSSPREYGLFLEDDVEVSPQYLNWINKVMLARAQSQVLRMVGISLYSPKVTETVFPKKTFDGNNITRALVGDMESPYFMQTPCSWGALYFPEWWVTFLDYMRARIENEALNPQEVVEVPHSRTNGWKQSWKKYMFELMYIRGSFILYPNFLHQESLSTNHLEEGEHIDKVGSITSAQKLQFELPLLHFRRKIDTLSLPPLQHLPILDCFGSPWSSSTHILGELRKGAKQDVKHDVPQGRDIMNQYQALDIYGLKSHLQTLPTKSGASTVIYRVNLQADGQLVMYRTELDLAREPRAVWSSGTYRGERPGYRYLLKINSQIGSVMLEEITSHNSRSVIFTTPPDRHRKPNSLYYLRLESTGILVLYRNINSCSRESVVWMSASSLFGKGESIWPPPRCTPSLASYRERLAKCKSFPLSLNRLLKADGLTLLIEHQSNFHVLQKQIVYYSASPLIHTIIVNWQRFNSNLPKGGIINGTYVRFHRSDFPSMNTRYTPLVYIATEAVMTLRDNIKIHLHDVSSMFHLWKRYTSKIVGVSPRWVHDDRGAFFLATEDPPYLNGVPNMASAPRGGFDILTASGLIFSKEYLYVYTCGSPLYGLKFDEFRQKVLKYVEDIGSIPCQDISLYIVLIALGITQGHESVALYLQPTYTVANFKGSGEESDDLTQCVNKIVTEFKNFFRRRLPIGNTFYVSRLKENDFKFVETSASKGSNVINKVRMSEECGRSEHGVTCSWNIPATRDPVLNASS